jgi:amino acid adenylation domain-containing protein
MLAERIVRLAHNYPNHIALTGSDSQAITYAELAKRIISISDFLKSRGINRDSRIAIVLPKTIDAVVSILAINHIGASYVPIDVQQPTSRIQQVLRDCDPNALISDQKHFPSAIPCQYDVTTKLEGAENSSITFFNHSDIATTDCAYTLYTSGSTGIPKGVCVSHTAATAFADWGSSAFPIQPGDQVASIAPLHFDLSVFDIYVTLRAGATLHLYDSTEIQNPRLMGEEIAKRKINLIYATPTFLSTLYEFGNIDKHEYSSLRFVLFAGEVFPVKQLHPLMSKWNHTRFFNLYGPTETNVCTYCEIIRDESRKQPYPIGKLLPNHNAEITSEGELLIGGPHVALGYLNRSELTQEKFFMRDGLRWFRTGDKVEPNANGEYIYIGRLDRMVKRRGYRIEPGEIENALQLLPAISGAVVIDKQTDGATKLIAVVTTKAHEDFDLITAKVQLANQIPAYMLPDEVIVIKEFPKTSSGKIDYVKLRSEVVSS